MKAKILVVDDGEDIRDLVRDILVEAGCEVALAADGAAVRQAFNGPPPDAVLLDLNLPDANGLELVPELKAKWPAAKIIIVTGDHTVATAEAAFVADSQVFLLNKPFDAGVLVAVVELALTQKPAA